MHNTRAAYSSRQTYGDRHTSDTRLDQIPELSSDIVSIACKDFLFCVALAIVIFLTASIPAM